MLAASYSQASTRQLLIPRRRHVVGNGDEERLHLPQLSIDDLEQLHEMKRVRAADRRLEHRAIRQLVLAEFSRVIDEAHREHEPALFVDQRKASCAQAIVVSIN